MPVTCVPNTQQSHSAACSQERAWGPALSLNVQREMLRQKADPRRRWKGGWMGHESPSIPCCFTGAWRPCSGARILQLKGGITVLQLRASPGPKEPCDSRKLLNYLVYTPSIFSSTKRTSNSTFQKYGCENYRVNSCEGLRHA